VLDLGLHAVAAHENGCQIAVAEALDAENGNTLCALLLAGENVLRAHAVAHRADADADGVGRRAEERVKRDDLVYLAAADVHAIGDGVRERGVDRPDLPPDTTEVVEQARPLGWQVVEKRGQLEDVDAVILGLPHGRADRSSCLGSQL